MPNILRDFFILEFAIYNFGNVAKQFRWIANGLSQIDNEFAAIESRLQKIQQLNQQMQELEKIMGGFVVEKPAEDTEQVLRKNVALIDQTKYDIAQLSRIVRGFVPAEIISMRSPKTANEALEQIERLQTVLGTLAVLLEQSGLREGLNIISLRYIERNKRDVEELRERLLQIKSNIEKAFKEIELPEQFFEIQSQLSVSTRANC